MVSGQMHTHTESPSFVHSHDYSGGATNGNKDGNVPDKDAADLHFWISWQSLATSTRLSETGLGKFHMNH